MKKVLLYIFWASLSFLLQAQTQSELAKKVRIIARIISKKVLQGDTASIPTLLDRYANILDANMLLIIAAEQSDLNLFNYLMSLPESERPDVNHAEPSKGYTPLISASFKGNTNVVQTLLNTYNVDVDTVDHSGNSALMYAADNGHTDIVNTLLQAGANPNIQNQTDDTALMFASEKGHTDTVKALLKAGADPNLQMKDGYTALMLASKRGYIDVVKTLLEADADPHAKNKKNTTALFFAIKQKSLQIVSLLLQKNPDLIHQKNGNGSTPLLEAVEHGDYKTVKILLDYGKEYIDTPNGDLMAPLAIAVSEIKGDMATEDDEYFNIVKLLLVEGANTETINKDGSTPLISAASLGYTNVVKALLEAGADPTKKNKKGKTALSLAASKKHTNIVQLLRDALSKKQQALMPQKPKKAKKRKKKKKTRKQKPAIECPRKDTPEPSPTQPDPTLTPPRPSPTLITAEQIQKQEKINNTVALWKSIDAGNPKEVARFLGKLFDSKYVDQQGNTFLMHAVKKAVDEPATRRTMVLQTVLDNSDITATINKRNLKEETALMLSAIDPTIMQQLLEHKANPDIPDERGNTVIIRAIQKDGINVANILTLLKNTLGDDQYNTLLNKQNHNDMSALMYAVQKSDPDNVVLLLQHSANPNLVNEADQTALELAHQVLALAKAPEDPDKIKIARAEEVLEILQEATRPEAPPVVTPPSPRKQLVIGDDPLFDELARGSRAKVAVIETIISEKPRDLLRQRAGGTTPLMVAIESNVPETVLRFIVDNVSKEHMELRQTTQPYESALIKAIKEARTSFVKVLLEKNVSFKKSDLGLAKALAGQAKSAKQKRRAQRLQDIVQQLEEAKTQQEQGKKLLMAAFAGDVATIDTTLDAGASINTQDEDGNTPLIQAIQAYKDATARHLIEREARLNIRNNQGQTALMLAVHQNNYGLADYLLQHGADDRIEDNTGQTAYGYAIEHGYTAIANRMRIHKALQNIQKTRNIAHTLQRHFDPRGEKITELVGPEDQDVDNNPYVGRLPNGTTASFFPRSWNSRDIYDAITSILKNPTELYEQPARITEEGLVIRNALVIKGSYQGIPIKVIISDVPQAGWILFTAYPDI